jgi:hypothetical protein
MKTLEAVSDEAAVRLVWAVDAEIARKNGVVMQRKMKQRGRKGEKKGQGKVMYVICENFIMPL